ncbi:hypothetical protein D3C73_1128460 [compost metagenome]
MAIVESLGAQYAERQGLVARQLLSLEDPVLAVVWSKDRAMSAPAQLLREGLAEQARRTAQPYDRFAPQPEIDRLR